MACRPVIPLSSHNYTKSKRTANAGGQWPPVFRIPRKWKLGIYIVEMRFKG